MLSYFLRGGIMMYPLLLASILSLAIIISKLYVLHRGKINQRGLKAKVKELVSQGKIQEALTLLRGSKGPLPSILEAGLREHTKGRKAVESAWEKQAEEEISGLQSHLPALATIASVSTLMGFTGTVLGMIRAFDSIAAASATSPAIVASGISEALITTAAGLLIAIPTLLFYRYFVHRVDRIISDTESYCRELAETLFPVE